MSQLSEMLEKSEPALTSSRLEAVVLVLEELIKVLSPEQRDSLSKAIVARHPAVKSASPSKPLTVEYQLLLIAKELIGSAD